MTKLGYRIVERNWRFSKAEIDIIAYDKNVLVFIEVKTRTSVYFGRPEEFITDHKEVLMADAAQRYMESIGHDWELRYDFVSIVINKDKVKSLEHFKDAFFS